MISHERRDPDWRFLWFERADSTTMTPWVTAIAGLLALTIWLTT